MQPDNDTPSVKIPSAVRVARAYLLIRSPRGIERVEAQPTETPQQKDDPTLVETLIAGIYELGGMAVLA
jgi:hypothetical protein